MGAAMVFSVTSVDVLQGNKKHVATLTANDDNNALINEISQINTNGDRESIRINDPFSILFQLPEFKTISVKWCNGNEYEAPASDVFLIDDDDRGRGKRKRKPKTNFSFNDRTIRLKREESNSEIQKMNEVSNNLTAQKKQNKKKSSSTNNRFTQKASTLFRLVQGKEEESAAVMTALDQLIQRAQNGLPLKIESFATSST